MNKENLYIHKKRIHVHIHRAIRLGQAYGFWMLKQPHPSRTYQVTIPPETKGLRWNTLLNFFTNTKPNRLTFIRDTVGGCMFLLDPILTRGVRYVTATQP